MQIRQSGNATCLTVRPLVRGGKGRRYHGQNVPRVLFRSCRDVDFELHPGTATYKSGSGIELA